ncbi:hypothetical protein QJS04_geneDACA003940 [Acorus gramineus]|uniref:Uncharacterized protein n=1 Tax=Acorus gramineus TaxID=55184 RepID=A0AAV9BFF1_ACOGR|nr:hypothetical protein QJS04_geneDACA003940 [Acorus gramineus]
MLSEIKWVWKRPIITMIYIGLFTFAYVFTVAFFMIVSMVIIKGATEVALIVVMALLATFYYLHLLAVWTIGLVVSVIEADCYGMDAIKKARELIKGRRLRGFALISFEFCCVFYYDRKRSHGEVVVVPEMKGYSMIVAGEVV